MHTLELIIYSVAAVLTTQSVKYREFLPERGILLRDIYGAGAAGILLGQLLGLGTTYYLAGALVWAALLFFLWLDAIVFRVFTIELGFGGAKDVVLSEFLMEILPYARTRELLRTEPRLIFFPLVLVVIGARFFLESSSLLRSISTFLLALYFWPFIVAARGDGRPKSSTGIEYFFRPRRVAETAGFEPRPEHRALFEPAPVPGASPKHGLLRGKDVVFLTFESAARDHFAMFAENGADSSWLRGQLSHAVVSRNHWCVSPTTNNAHQALYAEGVHALGQAGYRTIYLSAAETRHFGLAEILKNAGFEKIFDRNHLRPHALDGKKLSDYALLEGGLALLEAEHDERPLFLHVHATNTHVPYRVVDRARFSQHAEEGDRGRLLDGIQETDALFEQLYTALIAKRLARDPLLVVSSDHGQSFGELGYYSHGSAVIASQLTVPLLLGHPRLPPGSIECSSHFDVLPTILDLLGLVPTRGASIFVAARAPSLLIHAGHPSRATTSNYGMICGREKYLVDLIADRIQVMRWNDEAPRVLEGAEHTYYGELLARLMKHRGIS